MAFLELAILITLTLFCSLFIQPSFLSCLTQRLPWSIESTHLIALELRRLQWFCFGCNQGRAQSVV
jgi:hypothetical protein